MVRKPNYCKGIVIAHGKSELLLAEHIKSNLHLPIEIYAESNGKTSIQIDSLMTVLGNNIFKNKREFNKRYIVEEEKGILKNFSLMPIMDLDDTSEDRKQKYISGEMFKNHWLNPYGYGLHTQGLYQQGITALGIPFLLDYPEGQALHL